MPKLQKSSQTRLFSIEDRANPGNSPHYQALARALGLTWAQGDVTPIRVPDPSEYGKFITVDRIKGQQGLPSVSVEGRLTRELSEFLKLVRKGCAFDIQLHSGVCEDPRDFNGGWEKIYVLENAEATSYETGELGALDADQNAVINETIPLVGTDWYELSRINSSEIGADQIVQQVVGVVICDSRACGECGISSNGCEKVFAVTKSHGGSPGLPAEVIFSADAGATMDDTVIGSLGANEDPTGIACVGVYLVVISNESESLHYALLSEILEGLESWLEATTGFVGGKGPNSIFSLSSVFTWIVGDGGYIYFSDDITAGVEVQSAGAITVENLNAVHGADELNLIAVGDNNTVLFTRNGGSTWTAVTGPDAGVDLTACFAKTDQIWFVGTAEGKLWYTKDGGSSWSEKTFSGSGSGSVNDLKFSTGSVGYMAHTTAAGSGRIFRTIDGGFSWYILPEAAGLSIPTNKGINALTACSEDPNLVFGGGVAANDVDGILIKIA